VQAGPSRIWSEPGEPAVDHVLILWRGRQINAATRARVHR
jgi:hypothetical protein